MNISKIFKSLNNLLDKNSRRSLFFLTLLLLLVSIVELFSLATIPAFISYIISGELNYLNFSGTENKFFNLSFSKNVIISIIMFLFFLKGLFLAFASYYEINILKKIKIEIGDLLMKMYLSSKYKFFVDSNSSILTKNLIYETSNCVSFFQSIITIFKELTLLIVIFILVFLYNPLLSTFILFSLIIAASLFYLFTFNILKKNSIKRTTASEFVFKTINQSFNFIKDIKIFNKENFFFKLYLKNLNLFQSKLAIHDFLARLPKIFFEFFGVILIITVLFFGGIQDQSAENFLQILPFVALVSISIIKLLPSFKAISGSLTHIVAFMNSFFLISDEIVRGKQNENFMNNNISSYNQNYKFALELSNISFKYDKNVRQLNNISMKVKKNSIVGLIGRSGSGKTTLINIILGLFQQEEGEIKINTVKKKEFYDDKIIAYVPQDILILDDTLKNNIAFGIDENQIDIERVNEAIKLSGLTNFYEKNNKNLNISLGELGIKISGGEKQRIGIARALYFKPELLILDESTSSLDNKTESSILDEIQNYKKNMSIIMISHRLSTLKICDEIYYIEKGAFKDNDTLENLRRKYPEIESRNETNEKPN